MDKDEIRQIFRDELAESYRRILSGPITTMGASVRGIDLQAEIDCLTILAETGG